MFVRRPRAPRPFVSTCKAQAAEICPQPKKIVAKRTQNTYFQPCPISHVPVVVCQSVGIRTRGRTAAKGMKNRGSLLFEWPASLSRDDVVGLSTLCNRDWQS